MQVWLYEKVDGGEVCTPFILPLRVNGVDPPGCPTCHIAGECVLFNAKKQCMCAHGFRDFEQSDPLVPVLRDAEYLLNTHQQCVDVNECQEEATEIAAARARNDSVALGLLERAKLCPPEARCTNIYGSYTCTCNPGLDRLVLEGTYFCFDHNECQDGTSPCTDAMDGGMCENTYGSFRCFCLDGYSGSGVAVLGGCTDIDECSEYEGACAATQNCVNTLGSFVCYCPADRPRFFDGECYSDTFAEDNAALFTDWGRGRIGTALQGLVRFWERPHERPRTQSVSGLAQWYFLKDKSAPGVHSGVYHSATSILGWDCPVKQTDFLVSQAEGALVVNASTALGGHTFMWRFTPSESVLNGKDCYCIFSEFNFIHTPGLQQVDTLSFCEGAGMNLETLTCKTYNASHPPDNPVTVKLPFKILLETADVLPETVKWSQMPIVSPVKFALTYGLRPPKTPPPVLSKIQSLQYQDLLASTQRVFDARLLSNVTWELSIVNKDDQAVLPPNCGNARRQGLTDPFSSFSLSPLESFASPQGFSVPKTVHSSLNGFWTGTCNPRVPPSGPSCRVTFAMHHGTFELLVSGCSGWNIPLTANGILLEDGITKILSSIQDGAEVAKYRRFRVHYASGQPASSTPGHVVGYGSYKWTDFGTSAPDSITAVINAPAVGQTWHPGDHLSELFVSVEQEYPCQVFHLSRVSGDDARRMSKIRSPPDPSRLAEIQNVYRDHELYGLCRQQLQKVQQFLESNAECRRELEPLISATASILPPSQKILDSCSSSCLAQVTREMNKTHALCIGGWRQFTSSQAADSAIKSSIRERFQRVVMHVSEFFFRLTLACRGNYKRRMCNDVLAHLPTMIDATCRDRYEVVNISKMVTAIELLQLDTTKGNGGMCRVDCLSALEKFLVHGHCCLATIEDAHRAWLGALMTSGERLISFEVSPYLAEFGTSSPALIDRIDKAVTVRQPAEVCPSRNDHSLSCALETCALGNVWPEACCPPLACKNGGSMDYVGVCSCRCTIPYAGIECAEARLQVPALPNDDALA